MAHQKLNYPELFRRHGYRLTHQREVILDALCAAAGHARLGDIYYEVTKLDSSIDRSTVYRALDTFIELGLVISAENLQGERVYELVREEPHHHLVCRECGEEVEIDNESVTGFFKYLQEEYGYTIAMDHLLVFGLCPQCAG